MHCCFLLVLFSIPHVDSNALEDLIATIFPRIESNALGDFIDTNFHRNEGVVIIGTNNWNDTMDLFRNRMVIMLDVSEQGRNFTHVKNYLITLDHGEIERTMSTLRFRINPRGRFLMILRDRQPTESLLRSILLELTKVFIYKAALVYDTGEFVTWYPFENHSCGKIINLVYEPPDWSRKTRNFCSVHILEFLTIVLATMLLQPRIQLA